MDTSVKNLDKLINDCSQGIFKLYVPNNLLTKCREGTGFIVDSQLGLVVTNYHVLLDNQKVILRFYDKFIEKDVIQGKHSSNSTNLVDILTGRVIYVEPQYDLALIRIYNYVSNSLSSLVMSTTDANVGDKCISIGYIDIENTVHYGYVCSMSCRIPLNRGSLTNTIDNYFSSLNMVTVHSATAWPGSSGGPLIDMDCRVVGVLTAIKTYKTNIAIKVSDVKAFIQRGRQYMENDFIKIQNDRQNRFKRSFSLGIILTAFIVKGFTYNTTQARILLQLNDLITSVNGTQLTDLDQLTDALDNITSDEQVIQLTVRRETRLEGTAKRSLNEVNVFINPKINNNNDIYSLLSVGPKNKNNNCSLLWSTKVSTKQLMSPSAPVTCLRTVRLGASAEYIQQLNNYCNTWVVKINVMLDLYGKVSQGTGFLVDGERGLLVTNYHVVADRQNVMIQFANRFYESNVIQ
ncbi:probable serine protease HtrA1 [Oppia nitens]|uniref:probable serine protease HtrA1 n=1 Tax=Oppia nitens TaxID=1686743 RepID=UPI0023D99F00|nr:probable serine protease HtrA1 [Oppia nitens]